MRISPYCYKCEDMPVTELREDGMSYCPECGRLFTPAQMRAAYWGKVCSVWTWRLGRLLLMVGVVVWALWFAWNLLILLVD